MFFLSPDKNFDVNVRLLMTSLKSCLFGNEQTETRRFGPDSLNLFGSVPFRPCDKAFLPDLNQTQGQNAGWDVFRQHGIGYGRVG